MAVTVDVALRATGRATDGQVLFHLIEFGHRMIVDRCAYATTFTDLKKVAHQTKTGDISHRHDLREFTELGPDLVQLTHGFRCETLVLLLE